MTKFDMQASQAEYWEVFVLSGLAKRLSGQFVHTPHLAGHGQPSGDGRLEFGGKTLCVEVKRECFPSDNVFLETHGRKGPSSLPVAAEQGIIGAWCHLHARSDTLLCAKPDALYRYCVTNSGAPGMRYVEGAGDGGRAGGFIVNVEQLAAQPWVRVYRDFSEGK